MLYFKFILALALGLAGACLFLHRILDTVLIDWDPVQAARRWLRQARLESRMRRQTLHDTLEPSSRTRELSTRLLRPQGPSETLSQQEIEHAFH